jgi:phage FluMu gp28-like protein
MYVQGVALSNAVKQDLIEGLALAFERGEVEILADAVLSNELQSYQMERLPSGALRFSAPEGGHDDCVVALALAWSAASEHLSFGRLTDLVRKRHG